jgi:beta-glucosidase
MVATIAENCNNTIVVVNTVGPRILDSWIENDNITGVIYGGLLGQEGGNSLADVLYGDVNPSGRLAYTIAKNESDYNVEICDTAVCNFTEGNYVDYKYFDAYNVTPRYEFGYGLSYTTFDYSNASVSTTNASALASTYPTGGLAVGGKADLWDEVFSVSVNIANNGTVDGNEVAQLYIQFPDAADTPLRQLRGFERTLISAGDSTTVTFSVNRRDVSYWDVAAADWAIAKGDYVFSVGASSRDLRVSQTVTV